MIIKGCLLLLLASILIVIVQAEDSWSWGSEEKENVTSTDLLEKQLNGTNATSPVNIDIESSVISNGNETDVPTGRFFGFKNKLCKLGLAKNCNQDIRPAAQIHHGAISKPLTPASSYGPPASTQPSGSSYTSYQQQQFVQYKPQGQLAPLPSAIPIAPKPVHPIKGIINHIGSSFASLLPSHHKHPKPSVPFPSQASHSVIPLPLVPLPVQATPDYPKPEYDTIKQGYVAPQVGIKQSIVNHVHFHTHIHQGQHGLGAVSIQTVTLAPTRQTTTIIQPVTVTKILPSVVTTQTVVLTQLPQPTYLVPSPSQPRPSPPSALLEVETSYSDSELSYAEVCQCVPESYCELSDVVSYTRSPKDISHLLDPRNINTEILSNATNLQELKKNVTSTSLEQDNEFVVKSNDTQDLKIIEKSDEKRIRRDIKNYPANLTAQNLITDAEGMKCCASARIFCDTNAQWDSNMTFPEKVTL